jgi:hypothetical protein
MTFTISAEDPRTIRAIEIAAEAEYWLRGRNQAGEDVFGVPSQTEPGRYYIVSGARCECEDFKQHPDSACKHMLAVRLHTELARTQQRPNRSAGSGGANRRGHLSVVS